MKAYILDIAIALRPGHRLKEPLRERGSANSPHYHILTFTADTLKELDTIYLYNEFFISFLRDNAERFKATICEKGSFLELNETELPPNLAELKKSNF